MKKGLIIVLVIVLVVGAGLVVTNFQSTGRATSTLTPGANYGPIDTGFNTFSKCEYLSVNDGWDLTVKGKVRALDMKRGVMMEREDSCDTDTKLSEYHCEDGYMKTRVAICPSAMICKDGACVNKE